MTQQEFIKSQEKIHGYRLEQYLTKKEVAKRLRVCERTIDYWRESNDFVRPVLLPGGGVRFIEREVAEWTKRHLKAT